jgi:3',5'-cyclic AMP phosphodiesterase CpdA
MRLVQISDVHFTRPTWNPLRFCSKRLAGMANWFLFRRSWYSHEPLNLLPDLFQSLNVDLILVGGDLTSTSLPKEFQAAQDFFHRFSQPKLFIPGNHDQYTRGSHRDQRFYRFFQNQRRTIEHPLDFFSLAEHGIEVHRLQQSIWCIALDTAPPTSLTSSNGLFSSTVEKYLEEVLQSLPKNDCVIVLNHFPFFENDLSLHRLINAERLRAILERNPCVCLYMHGHTHRHMIADLRPNHLPLILDAGCPIQKPQSTWNLIDLTEQGCEVKAYIWSNQSWEVFKQASFQWNHS